MLGRYSSIYYNIHWKTFGGTTTSLFKDQTLIDCLTHKGASWGQLLPIPRVEVLHR